MDKLHCPHCNCEILNDTRLAGQVVSCPTCRNPFRMPDAPPSSDAFTFDPSAPAPPPRSAPVSPRPKSAPRAEAPPRPSTPAAQPPVASSAAEPWYYRFLEKYATVLMWLGLAQAVIALLVIGVAAVAIIISGGSFLYAIAELIVGLFSIVLFVIVCFFSVALIRLAVDMGRNLRTIRQQTEKK